MVDVDKQPAHISDSTFHPVEVHWSTHWTATSDSGEKLQEKARVVFSIPPSARRGRVSILDMSPTTALNLLNWLATQRETLEMLAQEASNG